MKKSIVPILCICFLLFPNTTHGETTAQTCSVATSSAPVLSQYLKNVRRVANNVYIETASSGKEKNAVGRLWSVSSHLFSRIINWESYENYVNFYLIKPLQTNIHPAFYRDYERIDEENERLLRVLGQLGKISSVNISQEKACKGIEKNCALSGNAKSIIEDLIVSNENIKNIFIKSVIGKPKNNPSVPLSDENFWEDFEKSYGKKNLDICNKSSDSFGGQVKDAFKNIGNNLESSANSFQEWNEAIALFKGDDIDDLKYQEEQRKLLQKELSRQGVSGSQQEMLLKNFDDYNAVGSFSEKNNFITNLFQNIGDQISTQYDSFSEAILQNSAEKKSIGTKDITKVDASVQKYNEIEYQIESIFSTLNAQIAGDDKSTNDILLKTEAMHLKLNETVKNLDKVIPLSQKVCSSQAKGKGICK